MGSLKMKWPVLTSYEKRTSLRLMRLIWSAATGLPSVSFSVLDSGVEVGKVNLPASATCFW